MCAHTFYESMSSEKEKNNSQPRRAQNFLLVWVDTNIDETKVDFQNSLTQLRSVVNDVKTITKPDQCVQFLKSIQQEKAFLIVSGSLGQHLIPDIHSFSQLDVIYIFCNDQKRHEHWSRKWTKVKGVHTNIKPICEALRSAVKQCNQDSIAVSFVPVSEGTGATTENLNQLDPTFMYTQIFKEILLEMEFEEKAVKELTSFCRQFYEGNKEELGIISEFEKTYQSKDAVWWYTRQCFTFQMLNRALRTLEGDTIINMGFFIRDLHRQIEQLYKKQVNSYQGKSFIVYRGQGLPKADFEKLSKSKGGLLSFNSFLSTSKKQDVSMKFATEALTKTDTVGILFEISIDPSISSSPFAYIKDVSYYEKEEEILFSMHTVFRINRLSKVDGQNELYRVELQLTADNDEQLCKLTEFVRKDVVGDNGWERLGNLLLRICQFSKAEDLYKMLIEQTSNELSKANYYNQLGYIKSQQGDYETALDYHKKGLAIKEKKLSPNHRSVAKTYNNIGAVYHKMKEYTKALIYYEKDVEISVKSLSSDDPHLAGLYNNIGVVCDDIGDYEKAVLFYKKALKIQEKFLPSNHPLLGTIYNNIGLIYEKMKEYKKALSFYERDLSISEKTLPSNHLDLGTSHANIGGLYKKMSEYSKALMHFERALAIYVQHFPPDHTRVQDVREAVKHMKQKLKSK